MASVSTNLYDLTDELKGLALRCKKKEFDNTVEVICNIEAKYKDSKEWKKVGYFKIKGSEDTEDIIEWELEITDNKFAEIIRKNRRILDNIGKNVKELLDLSI